MEMEDSDNAIDDVEDDGENKENASENEEEVEEEKDTEDEDEFMFREGTNPLDLVHNNDSGVQVYQRLLDHQALPNKNRKAPEQCHCEGTSSKKAREDDISGVCPADLVEVMNFEQGKISKKTRTKKRGRQKGSKKKLDEKLSQMLGDANLHYANRRYDMAISVLHEVVRLKPNLPESYHILGLVYRAIGNYGKEMISTLIISLLTPKDSSLWERLFEWSIEQGDIGRANCYISKAIKADPENSRFRIYRARLLAENQDYQKAAAAYEQVYQLC